MSTESAGESVRAAGNGQTKNPPEYYDPTLAGDEFGEPVLDLPHTSPGEPMMVGGMSRPKGGAKNMSECSYVYAVHADLLPFCYRKYNSLGLLTELRAFTDALIPTRRSWSLSDLCDETSLESSSMSSSIERKMTHVLGSWRLTTQAGHSVDYYLNPTYVHAHTLGDLNTDGCDDDAAIIERGRYEWARYCYRLGVRDIDAVIAKRFGLKSASDVQAWVGETGAPIEEWREQGERVMANTWATCYDWGYDFETIARAFDVRKSVVQGTVFDALNRGFEPPTDLSGRRNFKKTYRGQQSLAPPLRPDADSKHAKLRPWMGSDAERGGWT